MARWPAKLDQQLQDDGGAPCFRIAIHSGRHRKAKFLQSIASVERRFYSHCGNETDAQGPDAVLARAGAISSFGSRRRPAV